jgi:2'-5' RNA ligase
MMRTESIRAFIAIDLDNETRQRLLLIQRESLELHQFSSVKAVDPLTTHITLSFLGNISPSDLSAIRDALRSVSFHPFYATLSGIGAFPSLKKMRVIHVGLTDSSDLLRLRELVVESLRGVYEAEKRFDPHITLGRVKRIVPSEMKSLADVVALFSILFVGRFLVSSFQLKKSTLTPKGPIYDTLEEFKL